MIAPHAAITTFHKYIFYMSAPPTQTFELHQNEKQQRTAESCILSTTKKIAVLHFSWTMRTGPTKLEQPCTAAADSSIGHAELE